MPRLSCFVGGFFYQHNSLVVQYLFDHEFHVVRTTLNKNESSDPREYLLPWNDIPSIVSDGDHLLDVIPESLILALKPIEILALKMHERFGIVSEINGISGTEYAIRKYYDSIKFFVSLIKKMDFKFAIFANVPHEFYDFIFYHVLKFYNVPVLGFFVLPSRPYCFFGYAFEDLTNHFRISAEFESNLSNCKYRGKCIPSVEFEKSYLVKASEFTPFTRKEVLKEKIRINYGFLKPRVLGFHAFKYARSIILSLPILGRLMLSSRSVFWYYVAMFRRQAAKEGKTYFRNNRKFFGLDGKRFVYFPLHYQPEASTSPLAGNFVWQDNVVNYLCQALPADVKIVIKEHPRTCKQPWLRNVDFYKRIMANKNVYFVDDSEHSFDLIDNCSAVVTCTGSIGMEAIFRRKPVFCFGERFYTCCKFVFKITDLNSLFYAVDAVFNNNLESKYSWDFVINDFKRLLDARCFSMISSPSDLSIFQDTPEECNQNLINVISNWINSLQLGKKI